MATFVLVHGGWRGGWVWEQVAALLQAKGHTVHAPTLTGLAEKKHLLSLGVDLDTHIADVAQLMEFHDLKNVILCGHSSSGIVITGVAETMPERLDALVYLDAFVPQDGDSVFSLSSDEYKLFATKTAGQLGGVACLPLPPSAFGVPQEVAEMLERRSTPHPLATHVQGVRVTGKSLKVKKKIFALIRWTTEFPSPFLPFFERLRGDGAWRAFELEGSHDLMLEAPEKVADFLEASIV